MDSIEQRYCAFKALTGITLVLGLMITFGSLLSRESWEIERLTKNTFINKKKLLKFGQ